MEAYCKQELERISNRVNEIMKLYVAPRNADRLTKGQLTTCRKNYEKHWSVPKLKQQISVLTYLIK